MAKILREDDIEFEKVEWGLTKELVAPHTVGSKKIKVKITEWLPGHVHERHNHPDQEEVIYVLSGRSNWSCFFLLRSGSSVLLINSPICHLLLSDWPGKC